MPNPRTPLEKAKVSGALLNHPERFKKRKAPKRKRPVGKPYSGMSEIELSYWEEFVSELPWLHSGHRALLRMACKLSARMEDPEMGVSACLALSSVLSKLGATPVDETKVNHGDDGEEEDPGEAFFSRPN